MSCGNVQQLLVNWCCGMTSSANIEELHTRSTRSCLLMAQRSALPWAAHLKHVLSLDNQLRPF